MNNESIEKMVQEVLALEQEEACNAGALGYMARSLIQATLPHSKIDSHEFKRINGSFRLTILADSEIGLPFGSLPRLLMAWITTEAVRTKQRELILGRTLSDFMAELDLIPSGGRWGSITRLKDQMKRLFSAAISCTYDDGKNWGIRNVTPIEKAELWWDPKNPNQLTIWESKLLLGTSFFEEITTDPVPVDMRALKILRQSPMAIDIYCWLTYRLSYLRKITKIPWGVLQYQFGSNYKEIRQFKRRFSDQLKKVQFVYPDAKINATSDCLILSPGKSHIPKKIISPIEEEETLQNAQQNKQAPVETPKDIQKLERKYHTYRINTCLELVENLTDKDEKHCLLKEFDEYLKRQRLFEVRQQVIKGEHDMAVKEELYRFVDKHWHHILDSIQKYVEFCKLIAK